MYSRYHDRNEAPLRVPEHYSGYAFSRTPKPAPEPHLGRMDIAKPTPPPMPAPPRPALPPPVETPPKPAPAPPMQIAGIPLLSHGIGFEELLLLGLIVLLLGTEGGSDMILWLVLLLFLG